MTTVTLVTHRQTVDTEMAHPRRSLEELVDWLIETLFPETTEALEPSVTRIIHQARRLRQAGDMDGALMALAGLDTAKVSPREARWAFSEWVGLAKRRFGEQGALVYRQGTGRAAVLVPRADGTLEAVAVFGMRWKPGKAVSQRSLRLLERETHGGRGPPVRFSLGLAPTPHRGLCPIHDGACPWLVPGAWPAHGFP